MCTVSARGARWPPGQCVRTSLSRKKSTSILRRFPLGLLRPRLLARASSACGSCLLKSLWRDHTHTHTLTHSLTHTHTYTYTRTLTHTLTHSHTHTHTHTYTHTC